MTYIFTGFFIHDIDLGNINSIELSQIDGDSVIKEIEKPFHGLGVRLPNYDHLRQKANDIRIGQQDLVSMKESGYFLSTYAGVVDLNL